MSAPHDTTRLIQRKAVELLRDGQWHDYDRTIRTLGRVIPPGPAIRAAETQRLGQRHASGRPPERVKPEEPHRLIERGQTFLVRRALFNLTGKSHQRVRYFVVQPAGRVRKGTKREIRMVAVPAHLRAELDQNDRQQHRQAS